MKDKIFKTILVIAIVWTIAFIPAMFYVDHLERKYDPVGWEKAHQYTPRDESNYGFCDMWMVQVMPQFISPHGCN